MTPDTAASNRFTLDHNTRDRAQGVSATENRSTRRSSIPQLIDSLREDLRHID